jgi:hypothetical protein
MLNKGWSSILITLVAAALFVALALALLDAFPGRLSAPDTNLGRRAVPWSHDIHDVDEALTRHDVRTALFAWHKAYAAALASRHWDGLLAVGDAYLRIGEAAEYRRAFVPQARASYLLALERAHRASSIDGVIRAGEALGGLGDHAEPSVAFTVQR